MARATHPRFWFAVASLAVATWSPGSTAIAQTIRAADLVGVYDGHQMEMAAGLELRADGRFRYGLSYGALDEEAEGAWRLTDGQVLLTSDPVMPPRFLFLTAGPAPAGQLRIGLALPPPLDRQYFHAIVRFADGGTSDTQLGPEEDAPLAIDPRRRPVAVTLTLPIYDLRGDPVPLTGAGGRIVRFRFEPNGLGKVAFAGTVLKLDKGDLLLTRYDRAIRFRRVKE